MIEMIIYTNTPSPQIHDYSRSVQTLISLTFPLRLPSKVYLHTLKRTHPHSWMALSAGCVDTKGDMQYMTSHKHTRLRDRY